MVLASLQGILSWGASAHVWGRPGKVGTQGFLHPAHGNTVCPAQPWLWFLAWNSGWRTSWPPAPSPSTASLQDCAAPHLLSSCFQSLWILGCGERPRWAGPPRLPRRSCPSGAEPPARALNLLWISPHWPVRGQKLWASGVCPIHADSCSSFRPPHHVGLSVLPRKPPLL